MNSFPVFLELEGTQTVVVGGGRAALAKTRLLTTAGARVTVVSREPEAEFYDWAHDGGIDLRRRRFDDADLDGARLAVICTDDCHEEQAAADAASARGLFFHVVGRPALGNFVVPETIERGDVVVAIGAAETEPVVARRLRERIEGVLPERTGDLARFIGERREVLLARVGAAKARQVWEAFVDGPGGEAILNGCTTSEAEAALEAAIAGATVTNAGGGRVSLVGAGPGDPELLTVKALRRLQEADVVIHDALVGADILSLARDEAEFVYVGKQRANHHRTQDEINALIAAHARDGRRVVRLKGGDPFVFGRGGEEVDHLAALGIDVEIVPGITAATACGAVAGIPLTHRDHASSVTFVSGHGKDGEPALDWPALARANHTVVIYMGVASAQRTAAQLIKHGRSGATPVAVVERGTLPDERVFFGRLDGLAEVVADRKVRSPALIIVGEVVAARLSRGTAPAGREGIDHLAVAAE